ncbi:hypothetical protein EDD17DRAFT_1506414 [Pisolithus thermaeus]|nr:hypothetical protein EV401DRAFT_1887582 [Pisolithus croceorrhizus]KAI6164385.1 hypothetical protein EDD17DRAFT_1506414 [Pisolithus thermaeus]
MPFSRTVPRSNHELSMLLNRFSVMAVAIHLDPTLPNIRFRINQDRRCVDLKEADEAWRVACIYGMMYVARIMRLIIDSRWMRPLGWLVELANVLMDDCSKAETALLNGDKPRYASHTGLEIRTLTQSFPNARNKEIPPAQPPLASTKAVNPESRKKYEQLYLGLDNVDLLGDLVHLRYGEHGQDSNRWEKIIDSSWCRRVGLCFYFSLLRPHPVAYPKHQDNFISVLLISSVRFILSVEHGQCNEVHLSSRWATGEYSRSTKWTIERSGYYSFRSAILKNAAEYVRASILVSAPSHSVIPIFLSTNHSLTSTRAIPTDLIAQLEEEVSHLGNGSLFEHTV